MSASETVLTIDLFATTLEDFTDHFQASFCRLETFKPYMPELRWVNKTDANFEDFDWTYQNRSMSNEERESDSVINFHMFDENWASRPYVPHVVWEIHGYAGMQSPVRQIYHTVSAARYHNNSLRIVVQEGKRDEIGNYYKDGLFIQIFLNWLEARWGQLGKGYRKLDSKEKSKDEPKSLTVQQQKVADLTADGLTQGEIAKEMVITVHTVKSFKQQIRDRLGITGRNLAIELRQIGYGSRSR